MKSVAGLPGQIPESNRKLVLRPMPEDHPDLDAGSLLEPEDWESLRQQAHAALDVALEHIRQRPDGPVWEALPAGARDVNEALPAEGASIPDLLADLSERVLPHTLGNTHPRFWGWVHGSGTPSAVIPHMFMAAINANMGGREHAPIYLERQIINWMKALFGYPDGASGLVVTGTSSATLLGLTVARQRALGPEVRRLGHQPGDRLVAYCSQQAHVSVVKAIELMGLGSDSLRLVPVNDRYAMDCPLLERMLEDDLAAGCRPFAVISAVGSVNTGSLDDLEVINDLCRRHNLWHHVDGAFGALCVMSKELRKRVAGIELADSIAFDFHKWLHVTYSAGCLLVRKGDEHLAAFETSHAYLLGGQKGMAAGAPWPNDYGIDLSRGFSALGVWFLFKEMGVDRLGQSIYRNCLQAAWLGREVERNPSLELLAPVSLNIVCFRYLPNEIRAGQLNQLNRRLVVELQCRGIAAPSFTELDGRTAIRVCITNHRTRLADLQALVDATLQIGAELSDSGDHWDDYSLGD